MKYEIHQIQMTEAEEKIMEEQGRFSLDKYKVKVDMDFRDKDELVNNVKKAIHKGYYNFVANIQANGLEDVFRIGNQDIPRSENPNIEDINGMYSVSVGDLVISEEGTYVVASMGFAKVS